MFNLYTALQTIGFVLIFAINVQSQSLNPFYNLGFFNSEFSAVHQTNDGEYILAFNQFTNGIDAEGYSTGWIRLDQNLQIIDTAYAFQIDGFIDNFHGKRIKQFIKDSNGQPMAIYEYFDCDYFPSDGIVLIGDSLDFIWSDTHLLDIQTITTGFVGFNGNNRITFLDEAYEYLNGISFNTRVNDIALVDGDRFLVTTRDQIHILNSEGISLHSYEKGALHLSVTNDTILAISEDQFDLFDMELNLLESKEHTLIEEDAQLRFKQMHDRTYLFNENNQTEHLTEISQKGDSVRTVSLPKGTVINDLFEKNGGIYSIGCDVSGLKNGYAYLLSPPDDRSTTSSIKIIDFETPIDTEIDLSLDTIRPGNDSYAINTSCMVSFGLNSNFYVQDKSPIS